MPKFDFTSNVKPSAFAYVPLIKIEEEKTPELLTTAVLSTAVKNKSRAKKGHHGKDSHDNGMDVDKDESKKEAKHAADKGKPHAKADDGASAMDLDEKPKDHMETEEKKPEPEPEFETLCNPARVLPGQMKYLKLKDHSRYHPVGSVGRTFSPSAHLYSSSAVL